jgi:S1-C subfamily serine protease
MKRFLALAACLMINGITVHRMYAQSSSHPSPRPRAVHAHRPGGYLGVGFTDTDDDRAKALNLKDAHGVEVTSVASESPAAKAGVQVSDVIVEFNGQRVEGMEQFMRMVAETPPGSKVTLQVIRSGNPKTLTARTSAWRCRIGPIPSKT